MFDIQDPTRQKYIAEEVNNIYHFASIAATYTASHQEYADVLHILEKCRTEILSRLFNLNH